MVGKLVGGAFKIFFKILLKIPVIGEPLAKALLFFIDNLIKAIKRLPYVVGGAFAIYITCVYLGIL